MCVCVCVCPIHVVGEGNEWMSPFLDFLKGWLVRTWLGGDAPIFYGCGGGKKKMRKCENERLSCKETLLRQRQDFTEPFCSWASPAQKHQFCGINSKLHVFAFQTSQAMQGG